jgi:putative flippase GtrA
VNNPGSRARREFTRFVRFCAVGTIGFGVDAGTLFLLSNLLGLWTLAAQFVSFWVAVTSNFIWNRYWTYPDSRSKPLRAQALQFAVVNVAGILVIRTPFFALAEKPLQRLAASLLPALQTWPAPVPELALRFGPAHAGTLLTLVLAVTIVLFWNFGVNRLWTYSDVS